MTAEEAKIFDSQRIEYIVLSLGQFIYIKKLGKRRIQNANEDKKMNN